MKLVTKYMFQKVLNIRPLLIAFAICYLFMIIPILATIKFDSYSNIYFPIIYLFLGLTLLIEVVLFVLMLIKLFTEPNTCQFTSFLGLFFSELFCIFWGGAVYFSAVAYSIGLNELFVFLCAFLFPVISGLAYGILFIIKVLRCLVCFVLKQK
ncbi:hypothetical protein [Gilliamella sp. Pas-s95]|uniref:hypothetical protein n=1 Tax=Gilliamella sp. Pas-s95 TaxID=2687317 RepID=UPI0013232F15|nr:hypothetical protein [Gilliamella sp. Pas-s95]MWN05692.1 hypothetical protein [Gilliamella sp. Pas-s95]